MAFVCLCECTFCLAGLFVVAVLAVGFVCLF